VVTAKRWLLLIGGVLIGTAAVLALLASRIEPRLRSDVERALAKRLDSTVTLDSFDVRLFPRPAIVGRGLVIRHRGRTDLPPLITITSFTGHTGWEGLYSRHITEVMLDGLEITIPPQRRADMPSLSGPSSGDDGDASAPDNGSVAGDSGPPFSIQTVTATNARLSIMPKRADKDPRIFDIYALSIHDLTFVTPSTFVASLTNPIPQGLIETNGAFGPWNRDEPSETPVEGRYIFNADLGTIKGIAGAVAAQGQFNGVVNHIATSGSTKTPDFRLPKLKASALALQTTYRAVVDGTNGDVHLEHVDVHLGGSTFIAKGLIVGTKGIKGKRVVLNVTSEKALMADILRLTVRTLPPAMTGAVRLKASFDLPQGPADVLDKLRLEGQVAVNGARFTTPTVQDKVDELSQRGLGRPKDPGIDNVPSRINSAFSLKAGVLTLHSLAYLVPGAAITMSGAYNLESGTLNFSGAARLDASLSRTQTGYRRFLLKPFYPLFRKGGTGTRVAINVSGTVDEPKIGVDLKRTLRGQ